MMIVKEIIAIVIAVIVIKRHYRNKWLKKTAKVKRRHPEWWRVKNSNYGKHDWIDEYTMYEVLDDE